MIYSMTGYGKGEVKMDGLVMNVEIKTVNHRYADINVKMPRSFMALENEVRKQVGRVLKRGKVDLFVNYEVNEQAQAAPVLNSELARSYRDVFSAMREELGLKSEIPVALIAGQKDVVQVQDVDLDEQLVQSSLQKAVELALEQLVAMRKAEGEETRKDMAERLETAEAFLAEIETRAPEVPREWQAKLTERLARLQQGHEADPQRVAQEIAVFADRCDISEELARFKSHLIQFRELFDDAEPVGRRMDFLVQELNREVNTMGSKANDAELTRLVVNLKAEFEKVREQVQNIE
jgi:uncharacterized protein (TIGR00255 family)